MVSLSIMKSNFSSSGERAAENDPTERSSQSPGVQTEVFNKSQHLPIVQKMSFVQEDCIDFSPDLDEDIDKMSMTSLIFYFFVVTL